MIDIGIVIYYLNGFVKNFVKIDATMHKCRGVLQYAPTYTKTFGRQAYIVSARRVHLCRRPTEVHPINRMINPLPSA